MWWRVWPKLTTHTLQSLRKFAFLSLFITHLHYRSFANSYRHKSVAGWRKISWEQWRLIQLNHRPEISSYLARRLFHLYVFCLLWLRIPGEVPENLYQWEYCFSYSWVSRAVPGKPGTQDLPSMTPVHFHLSLSRLHNEWCAICHQLSLPRSL